MLRFYSTAPFLTAAPGICQNYCIIANPLVSFAHLLTASLVVFQPQTERLSEKGPSPSLANSLEQSPV